jgi:hypothetical protein
MLLSQLKSAAIKSGFEAVIVLCGKVVNKDGSLGHLYNTPGAAEVSVFVLYILIYI